MAAKSANLYARIEPEVKEQAESILSAFEVKLPSEKPVHALELTETELSEQLEKGYADMKAGRTKSARQTFSDIRKDYNL